MLTLGPETLQFDLPRQRLCQMGMHPFQTPLLTCKNDTSAANGLSSQIRAKVSLRPDFHLPSHYDLNPLDQSQCFPSIKIESHAPSICLWLKSISTAHAYAQSIPSPVAYFLVVISSSHASFLVMRLCISCNLLHGFLHIIRPPFRLQWHPRNKIHRSL